MNFCQPHWDLLRDAVAAAGLAALVSDQAELIEKAARQLRGEETNLANYDPLLSACMSLSTFCYDAVGPENARKVLLEGHCPICVANHVHAISCDEHPDCGMDFARYIDNAVADEVERAKQLLTGEGPTP